MEVTPTSSIPQRSSSRRWIIAAAVVAGLVGLLFCLIVGVGVLSLLGKRVEPTVVTATDGQSQLTVPTGWKVQEDLNEQAEIQVGNLLQEQYMVVLTENKSDFDDVNLEQYADGTLGAVLEMVETDEYPTPRSLTINGKPAIQYELHGTIDNMKAAYWLTNVEGTDNYYQVVAWTLESKAEKNEPVFEEVVQSFREVVK